MSDYSKSAVYDVRKVLWNELVTSGVIRAKQAPQSAAAAWEVARYDDYVDQNGVFFMPIIPVQEQDTFKNSLGITASSPIPYIVYDLDLYGYDTDWIVCKERLTFKIYANSFSKVATITNLMVDLFRRFDESAKTVNTEVKTINPSSPFAYKYFTLTEANSPDPAEELSGRLEADIAIMYAYTRNIGADGRFA